jgi:hypothetical protein
MQCSKYPYKYSKLKIMLQVMFKISIFVASRVSNKTAPTLFRGMQQL